VKDIYSISVKTDSGNRRNTNTFIVTFSTPTTVRTPGPVKDIYNISVKTNSASNKESHQVKRGHLKNDSAGEAFEKVCEQLESDGENDMYTLYTD